jgi:hypothetical protein
MQVVPIIFNPYANASSTNNLPMQVSWLISASFFCTWVLTITTRHLLIMDDTFFPDDKDAGLAPELPKLSLQSSALHSTHGPTMAWHEAVHKGLVRHNYSFIERGSACFKLNGEIAPDGTLEWENCMEQQFGPSWHETDSGVSVGAYVI